LRAVIACASRDRDEAVRLLLAARSESPSNSSGPLIGHSVRRRLGVLMGGDQGKALVAEADAFFRAGGAVDPERLVVTISPGLEIR
jgi:hypothetical protein